MLVFTWEWFILWWIVMFNVLAIWCIFSCEECIWFFKFTSLKFWFNKLTLACFVWMICFLLLFNLFKVFCRTFSPFFTFILGWEIFNIRLKLVNWFSFAFSILLLPLFILEYRVFTCSVKYLYVMGVASSPAAVGVDALYLQQNQILYCPFHDQLQKLPDKVILKFLLQLLHC